MEEPPKQTCKLLKWHKEELLELFFFKKKRDSIRDILCDTEVNTVFEFYIVYVFCEIFSQLRSDERTNLITRLGQSKSAPRYETRRSKKFCTSIYEPNN